jgi:drug/metabolite transporter (DMT)-like permease
MLPTRTSLTGAPWWPYAVLTFGMFLFASDVIVGRLAAETQVPPLGLAFWRTAGAALVLAPFVAREVFVQRRLLWQHRKVLVLLGLSISVFGGSAVYSGLAQTTALNGGVVTTAQAAIMALLGWLLYGDRVTGRQAAGLVVAAFGVLAIVCRGDIDALLNFTPHAGDLLVLLGVTGYAFYIVNLRRAPPVSVYALLCVTAGIGTLFNAVLYAAEAASGSPLIYTPETVAMIVWISLFVSIGAIGCMTAGALRLGSQIAAGFNYVRTLFTLALAVLLLGETISPYQVAGAALIVVGVVLMTLRQRRRVAVDPVG